MAQNSYRGTKRNNKSKRGQKTGTDNPKFKRKFGNSLRCNGCTRCNPQLHKRDKNKQDIHFYKNEIKKYYNAGQSDFI
jgi:hypothetical protein